VGMSTYKLPAKLAAGKMKMKGCSNTIFDDFGANLKDESQLNSQFINESNTNNKQ